MFDYRVTYIENGEEHVDEIISGSIENVKEHYREYGLVIKKIEDLRGEDDDARFNY